MTHRPNAHPNQRTLDRRLHFPLRLGAKVHPWFEQRPLPLAVLATLLATLKLVVS
jgi:hypothetical protein